MFIRGRNNGWLTTEVIVSIGVLSLIFFAFIKTMGATGRLNRLLLARQQCTSAAQAQLDCIEATGEKLSPEDIARLWQGLGVTVEESVGKGDWKGLRLIKVTATNKSLHRKVEVQLCRYVSVKQEQ
ncbi:MAG: hypothetical protein DRP65_01865 [Planctomycetota bacterium]|nr:MAG: hypothetical protein DRP65_01865 [Planctomycetota bacterium]